MALLPTKRPPVVDHPRPVGLGLAAHSSGSVDLVGIAGERVEERHHHRLPERRGLLRPDPSDDGRHGQSAAPPHRRHLADGGAGSGS